jgi:lipoyl(octanoyl) transferase
MQTTMARHLAEVHGIHSIPSDNTGVFLDPITKIASIGVQVRHRLTSHGFALNVTREPIPWFARVVACGLDDVKAGSIEVVKGSALSVEDEIPAFVKQFGNVYGRQMVQLNLDNEKVVGHAIGELESEAEMSGDWAKEPVE